MWPYLILSNDGNLYDADTGERTYRHAPEFHDCGEAEAWLIDNNLPGKVIQ